MPQDTGRCPRLTGELEVQDRLAGGEHLLEDWLDDLRRQGTISRTVLPRCSSAGIPFISAKVWLIWRYRNSLSNKASPAVAPVKNELNCCSRSATASCSLLRR